MCLVSRTQNELLALDHIHRLGRLVVLAGRHRRLIVVIVDAMLVGGERCGHGGMRLL
jgi:hypothetical protein